MLGRKEHKPDIRNSNKETESKTFVCKKWAFWSKTAKKTSGKVLHHPSVGKERNENNFSRWGKLAVVVLICNLEQLEIPGLQIKKGLISISNYQINNPNWYYAKAAHPQSKKKTMSISYSFPAVDKRAKEISFENKINPSWCRFPSLLSYSKHTKCCLFCLLLDVAISPVRMFSFKVAAAHGSFHVELIWCGGNFVEQEVEVDNLLWNFLNFWDLEKKKLTKVVNFKTL